MTGIRCFTVPTDLTSTSQESIPTTNPVFQILIYRVRIRLKNGPDPQPCFYGATTVKLDICHLFGYGSQIFTPLGTVKHLIPVMYPYFGHLRYILGVFLLQENEAIKTKC